MVTDESVRFVHSDLFILRGVQAPDETIALTEPSSQTHASLLSSLDDTCEDAEKAPAVAQLLFTGLGGIEKMTDRNDRIARLVGERAKLREEKRQTSPYLLVQYSGTSRLLPKRHMKDLENMVVAFDALDKGTIRRVSDQAVAATLIALASELPDLGIEKVLSATVGYLEDERPLYSFGFEAGSLRVTVNKTLSPDLIANVFRRANALASLSEDEIPRAQRLLLSSLQETEDRLRAFLFAWTALEVLLSKAFSQHRKRVSQLLSDGQPVAVQKYVEWIDETIPTGRHNIRDKFTTIATSLSPAEPWADLKEFKELKKVRDDISHGKAVADSELPVERTRALASKYIARQAEHEAITLGANEPGS